MSNRICSLPDCERPHQARGYCHHHYNKLLAKPEVRWAKQEIACAVCGTMIVREMSTRYQPTCSSACRTSLEWGPRAGSSTHNRDIAAMGRARAAGSTRVERVSYQAIFKRDDWTCYLCGERTDPFADCYLPSSATIDHVIPLSKGGDHTASNCRTACLGCNSSKGAALLDA